MKGKIAFSAMFVAAMLPSACNTVEGVGEDVQAGGEAIEETAQDVKEDINN